MRLRPDYLLLACVYVALLAFAVFFAVRIGIEADEPLMLAGLYPQVPAHWSIGDIPLMVLSYLGALKGWICRPLVLVWGPVAMALRLPAIVLSAATVVFFWWAVRLLTDRTAAWIAALLLASDSTFLLMTAIDFGPVALQLFLKTAALLLVLQWHRSGRTAALHGALFLCGLALWDKAVFIWIAAGLLAGAVFVWRRPMQLRVVLWAGITFCAGALPLIAYNVVRPLDTFRRNARLAPEEVVPKFKVLGETLAGAAMFGFVTEGDSGSGLPRRNLTPWAFAAAVAGIPFLRRWRRTALFGAVAFSVSWLAMAISAGAGAASHHVLLLWPMHFLVISAVLVELLSEYRLVLRAGVAILVFANLLVTARYVYELNVNGPGIRFTRAIYSLTERLSNARRILVVDWGIYESLSFVSAGRLPVLLANEYTSGTTDSQRRVLLQRIMGEPGTVFITHSPRYEQITGVNSALALFAESATNEMWLRDEFGRHVFTVLRFGCVESD